MLLPDSAFLDALIQWMGHGLFDLTWWQIVLVTLGLTHITIASVTIFLHRHQAHRALDLHAIPSHFFRFWLWLTTGQVTKEWAAIHRKHHAKCEQAEDPHSPHVHGIKTVLLTGAELYRKESKNLDTMKRYGHGTPDDWIERNLYTRFSWQGVALMLIIDVALFGFIGLTIWAVQMAWIPITAAGIINGAAHYWGYRNFEAHDASTNISPWGILIGGEELHNNHHTYPTSAKLSVKPYEFDIGWVYIRTLEIMGLATVKKTAPRLAYGDIRPVADEKTLEALIANRYEVMAGYARNVRVVMQQEASKLKLDANGNAVYSGTVNINGRSFALTPTDFNVSNENLTHFMHGLSVKSRTQGVFDWEIATSLYDYANDLNRASGNLSSATTYSTAGRLTDQAGTGWRNSALKGTWRPDGLKGPHLVDFGYQQDHYTLQTITQNTAINWDTAAPTTLASKAGGRTHMHSLYVQDAWRFACFQNACNRIFNGRLHFWVIGITHMAQRSRQIGRANEDTIHTRCVGDGVQVFQSFTCFGLHQQANLFIGLFGVIGKHAPA